MSSVTVIIVNWNCRQTLFNCLSSVFDQSLPADKVVVVDNNSHDHSMDALSAFSDVIAVSLKANVGFAAANNVAFALADTDFIALLNPDAFAHKDWLKQLVTAAHSYPQVSAFGSQQLIYGSDNRIDGLGDNYHISGLFWRNQYGKPKSLEPQSPKPVFSVCACAALYRKSALLEVGGFDEDFFCYAEDVDLGFRLRLAGHHAIVVPDALVHHVGSATSGGRHSPFAVYHGHRNLVWTFIKNMPNSLFWLLLPLHIALNFITVLHFSLKGQGNVIFKAKLDALKGLQQVLLKRRLIQKNKVVRNGSIWQLMRKGITK